MNEFFPILLGALLGVATWPMRVRARLPVFAVGSIVIGGAATYFSGEYQETVFFVIVDTLEALAAMLGASWLIDRVSRGGGHEPIVGLKNRSH
jgi:hypothetical protein